jgi:hypothetical protein
MERKYVYNALLYVTDAVVTWEDKGCHLNKIPNAEQNPKTHEYESRMLTA